ncbi:glycosyltransferase [Cryomorphaceae bacterium 1068]|nr:glycosyltransferase [Cryomorphaceae bacterium 1068]
MKLLFVIPSITNYFTFLEDLTHELIIRGHEVHLATSRKHIARIDAYRRGIECEVHHIDFPRALAPLKHISAGRQVNDLVQEIKPDLINIHFSAALFTTMLGKKDNWPASTGTIHGLGSPLIKGWRKYAISQAERWSSERVDEVFVLTQDDKEYLKEKAPKATVSVLNSFGMGCDLDRFDPKKISKETKQELRVENGVSKEDFVFIFIGRQTHFKGFDKVVLSFLQLKKKHQNIKLLLIGEKDRIHPTSKQQRFEKALKEDKDIVRVGWKENVQDYLAIADLNVFPSEREGLPVNLMESLSMGVPVITINSRGCKEVVRNNVDGLVLSNHDVEHLSSAMERLLVDREELSVLAKNAFEGRNRFSRQHFIDDQLKTYDRLLQKKH